MHKHCKGCKSYWPHGKGKFSDWCPKYSNVASKIVGHCKLNNGKVTDD